MEILNLDKFKQNPNEDYDTVILNILKLTGSSISLDTLHFLTKIPKHRLSKKLRKLEKYKKVRKVTCSKTSYWVSV